MAHLIRQIGVCPDMAGAYLATDLVALPQIEPPAFPLAAAEAMAMARPVIATNVGALPEFVLAPPNVLESARTGWLAEPDDPVGFARAIADALAPKRQLTMRSEHARAASPINSSRRHAQPQRHSTSMRTCRRARLKHFARSRAEQGPFCATFCAETATNTTT